VIEPTAMHEQKLLLSGPAYAVGSDIDSTAVLADGDDAGILLRTSALNHVIRSSVCMMG
jgi:hypothetical protein